MNASSATIDQSTVVDSQSATHASIAEKMDQTLRNARLRILIVGAGIAGATLAALLRRQGEHPVVVERQPKRPGRGYMLGLLPLGCRVLHALNLHDKYLESSQPVQNYEFYNRQAQLLSSFSFDEIISRFGEYRGVERGVLVDLLRRAGDDSAFHYDAEITDLVEHARHVEVTFSDDSQQTFDLVVAADGIHSPTRKRVMKSEEVSHWKTGWGGWVYWLPPQQNDTSTYREVWGAGYGMGLYPVADRVGMFVGGKVSELEKQGPADYIRSVQKRLPEGPFQEALQQLDSSEGGFLWKLDDVRAKRWNTGRVLLLGDAAAGFLPTAGVGASMAMDSAAALADELSRAERSRIMYALSLYERRQRNRVERAQNNSRMLARLMFTNSATMAFARDQMMRFYSAKSMINDLAKLMEGR